MNINRMWIWSEYDTDGKAWPHTCFPIMAWCKQHRILVYKAVTPSNFGHLVKAQKDAKPGSVKHRDPSCWRSFGGLLRKQKQNYAVNSCMTLPHLSLFSQLHQAGQEPFLMRCHWPSEVQHVLKCAMSLFVFCWRWLSLTDFGHPNRFWW